MRRVGRGGGLLGGGELHGWSGRRGSGRDPNVTAHGQGSQPMAWPAGARLPRSLVRLLSLLGHRGLASPLCALSQQVLKGTRLHGGQRRAIRGAEALKAFTRAQHPRGTPGKSKPTLTVIMGAVTENTWAGHLPLPALDELEWRYQPSTDNSGCGGHPFLGVTHG